MTFDARFDGRIGGVLVAPRRTFAALAAGAARGGDVAWLLAAKLVASQFPSLVRALSTGRELGALAGVQSFFMVARELLPDVLGILAAGIAMSLFVGKTARGYGRTMDLAAYAWVPYVTLELAAALYFTARGYPPTPQKQQLVDAAALGWAVIAWAIALVAARMPLPPPPTTPTTTTATTGATSTATNSPTVSA
jgi:hypothetical protein